MMTIAPTSRKFHGINFQMQVIALWELHAAVIVHAVANSSRNRNAKNGLEYVRSLRLEPSLRIKQVINQLANRIGIIAYRAYFGLETDLTLD